MIRADIVVRVHSSEFQAAELIEVSLVHHASDNSSLRLSPGEEGPAGALIVVIRARFLHNAVSVLMFLILQMAGGKFSRLHTSHLLVDGSLRV